MKNSIGLSAKEASRYSVVRAMNALATGNWAGAGLERACHLAMVSQVGESERQNSFYLPSDLLARDLTAGVGSGGGYLVGTTGGNTFIDLLRNRLVTAELGATILSGLQGNVTIPKQIGAATASWLATESATIPESNMTLGQLALTPKTVGAYQEFSRQLMLQSTPAVDGMVMNDLAVVVALAVDAAALNGSGTAGQPLGIINTAGIGGVVGTSLGYAGILEFQTDVANQNAMVSSEKFGYVTTPAVAGLLSQRQRFTSTDSPVWGGNLAAGILGGCKAITSLQMPAASMLAGDFSQLVIAEWGVLELAVNPFAGFQSGVVGVRAIYSCDVGVRVPGAFSYATSIT